jgi:ribulose 1,5-bisphosphate synthetase/thiazole synthase
MSEAPIVIQAPKAKIILNIVIVGCGVAGLSAAYCLGRTGHKITVVESASAIGDVGAGIQVAVSIKIYVNSDNYLTGGSELEPPAY